MSKPLTIAQMLPSEAWERYVGAQTPAEFMRNSGMGASRTTAVAAVTWYVTDENNHETDDLTGSELSLLISRLVEYIEGQG